MKTECRDCKQTFAPTQKYYNGLFNMFRSDLIMQATHLMDSVCFDCISKRIMRKNFENPPLGVDFT